jgi:hypothetical protein
MSSSQDRANVLRFRRPRSQSLSWPDQKNLMEAVYAAGSLPVRAEDRETKAMAARLQLFGFVAIEEIQPDGSARALRPSQAVNASPARPWRVSKPAADGRAKVSLVESRCADDTACEAGEGRPGSSMMRVAHSRTGGAFED